MTPCPVGLDWSYFSLWFGTTILVPTSTCLRRNGSSGRESVMMATYLSPSTSNESAQYASASPQHETAGLSGCISAWYHWRTNGSVPSHCPKSRALATLINKPNAVQRTRLFMPHSLKLFQPVRSKQCSCRESVDGDSLC